MRLHITIWYGDGEGGAADAAYAFLAVHFDCPIDTEYDKDMGS